MPEPLRVGNISLYSPSPRLPVRPIVLHAQFFPHNRVLPTVNAVVPSSVSSVVRPQGASPAAEFFNDAFREHGSAYFFAFKKNLRVTNIQYAELVALTRSAITDRRTGLRPRDLVFMSSNDFKSAAGELIDQLGSDSTVDRTHRLFSGLYVELFGNMVVIDTFYGSCAVFLPEHLDLDLRWICAHAGYIHSCGRNVHIRATDKARKEDLAQAVERHLERCPSEKRVFLAAYAHEDFTDYDRKVASALRHGLDDLKIHLEKFYMGSERLPSVLEFVQTELGDKIIVPPPGDYHRAHRELRNNDTVDPSRTLWLILDRAIGNGVLPGDETYFICYDQQFINESPFHIFDENKPAWIAHTTIPHTLMGAMINLTQPWRLGGEVLVCDPFLGTGTTWFEGLKFSSAKFFGSDLNPISPLLVEDNLEFFRTNSASLAAISVALRSAAKRAMDRQSDLFPDHHGTIQPETYDWAVATVLRLTEKEDFTESVSTTAALVGELRQRSLSARLIFYVALRVRLRYLGAFARRSVDWHVAFAREVETLASQIEHLQQWSDRTSRATDDNGEVVTFEGRYSCACSIAPSRLRTVAESQIGRAISVMDARRLGEDSFDIIVADPPYGFNTEDAPQDLAELYRDFIRVLVRAIRDRGHLVLCLPARSHTGRRLPVCTRRDLVTLQVLSEAEASNREVVVTARALPQRGYLFRPPYYWESERALRRTILHFQFRVRDSS